MLFADQSFLSCIINYSLNKVDVVVSPREHNWGLLQKREWYLYCQDQYHKSEYMIFHIFEL